MRGRTRACGRGSGLRLAFDRPSFSWSMSFLLGISRTSSLPLSCPLIIGTSAHSELPSDVERRVRLDQVVIDGSIKHGRENPHPEV